MIWEYNFNLFVGTWDLSGSLIAYESYAATVTLPDRVEALTFVPNRSTAGLLDFGFLATHADLGLPASVSTGDFFENLVINSVQQDLSHDPMALATVEWTNGYIFDLEAIYLEFEVDIGAPEGYRSTVLIDLTEYNPALTNSLDGFYQVQEYDEFLGVYSPYLPATGSYIALGDIGDFVYATQIQDPTAQGDLIRGTAENDYLTGQGARDTIHGKDGNDAINGNAGDDLLFGEAGNDDIRGGKGNDTINGGGGRDNLAGDDGNDKILGGSGSDSLAGGAGHDLIKGGGGNDFISDVFGNDTVYGNGGLDKIDVVWGDDLVFGGGGADKIWGSNGSDTLSGDGGNDTLFGGQDNDIIRGGKGADILVGDAGDDQLTGGSGADEFRYSVGHDVITDFSAEDKLRLTEAYWYNVERPRDLAQYAHQDGDDLILDFGKGNILELRGMTYEGLHDVILH
ncbi:calcium-binding protein [Donghicola mangrovi]|uniref:Calcium-binding protein n=1 Tax=Donghicola mangrovi TaxID=2729614 RepID=A0A850Q5I0_9RHOB|nr:calcium-binding protein [Donghicola mangrovi]NVO24376.1 calcium-binding protein [Donghicola mangrovi]